MYAQATSADQSQGSARKASHLRVKVFDTGSGKQTVNVRVPLGIVRWGMKMARTFSPELKDANLDWDAIGSMIDDGAQGEIVHVEDEEKHETVEVWVE